MEVFCGATDTPVFDFWWHLPWVSKPGWIPCLCAPSPVWDKFIKFTSGATPADLLAASMAVQRRNFKFRQEKCEPVLGKVCIDYLRNPYGQQGILFFFHKMILIQLWQVDNADGLKLGVIEVHRVQNQCVDDPRIGYAARVRLLKKVKIYSYNVHLGRGSWSEHKREPLARHQRRPVSEQHSWRANLDDGKPFVPSLPLPIHRLQTLRTGRCLFVTAYARKHDSELRN